MVMPPGRVSAIVLGLQIFGYFRPAAAGFLTWTQSHPQLLPMELNEIPRHVTIQSASCSNLSNYGMIIIAEYANQTVESMTSIDQLLEEQIDAPTLMGLRREIANKTGAGTCTSSVFFGGQGGPQQVALLRLGKQNSRKDARKVGGILADLISGLNVDQKCAVVFSNSGQQNMTGLDELLSAFWTGLYNDQRFRGTDVASSKAVHIDELHSVDFIVDQASEEVGEDVRRGRIMAEAVYLARDIVNAPHNVLNSCSMAATAMQLAKRHGRRLLCKVLDSAECEQLGMGGFLGVARGSETQAQFIHLTYRATHSRGRFSKKNQSYKRLGMIGKSVLFDTGGYNIKTGPMGMTYMKLDCGGAAAVLGAAHAIASLQPDNIEVHFVIPACENMINERAMVPGDILKASNGKTIEVLNTDAEGRLTLADALVYADKMLGCQEIVELSTLTGSCSAALGPAMAGIFTTDNDMAEQILRVSDACGEKVWRLPMEQQYQDDLKSKLATLKNLGSGKQAGAITAALFLQHFVEDAKYTHVDMAGTAFNFKAGQASGWGVRFLTEWAHQQASSVAM